MSNEIVIDEEFKHLMPPLGKEAYAQLEENLLVNGCLSALILWEGILIDGHNRHEICTKHNIPFETVDIDLPSRDSAMLWIIEMQSGRRNLTPNQLFYYRGLHYRTAKKLVGERGAEKHAEKMSQNGTAFPEQSTAEHLANKYHVSRNTINRDAKASEGIDAIGEISAEAKKKVLSHDVRIGKRILEELASAPKERIAETANAIEKGTYNAKSEAPAKTGMPIAEGSDIEPIERNQVIPDTAIATVKSRYDMLLNTLKTGTAEQTKQALKACIDLFESMCQWL